MGQENGSRGPPRCQRHRADTAGTAELRLQWAGSCHGVYRRGHTEHQTGTRPCGARAKRPGDELVDPAEVIAWCRENMANYKVPRSVQLVAALPRNTTGKVLKYELRAAESARRAADERP